MDRIKKMYDLFKALTKKGLELYPIDTNLKSSPRVKELREISANFPIYLVLIDNQNKIFKAIILTEDVELGWINHQTPMIKLSNLKTILVALPFWVYLDENFLLSYTKKLGILNDEDIYRLENYAERTKIPQDIRGKYIRSLMELLSPYNTGSILSYLEKLEEKTVIYIPNELKKKFEEQFGKK